MKKACFILLGVFLTTILLPIGEWHPEKDYWPRTLIDSSYSEIEEVRQKVTEEPYLSIYNSIISVANSDYGDTEWEKQKARICRSAAFVYFIESDTSYADKSLEYLLEVSREPADNLSESYDNIIWDSEIIEMVVIAYDFLKGNNYDFNDQEVNVRNQLKNIISSLFFDLVVDEPSIFPPNLKLIWDTGEAEQMNFGVKFAAAMGMSAIVLNDLSSSVEAEQPLEWIEYSMSRLEKQFNDWLVDEDGGWAEGPHYQKFSAANFIPFAIAHNNFVNGEIEEYAGEMLPPLVQNENFINNALWGLRIRQHNGARPDIDDSFRNPYYFNGILASVLNKPELNWDYENADNDYYVGASSGNIDVEMICAYDVTFPSEQPEYLNQFLPNSGQTIFRSSWDEDAVYMALIGENGVARTGGDVHEHPDNTSFIIHAYEQLLAMDCGYINWSERDRVRYAENHSLILVDGEGPSAAGLNSSGGTDAYIVNSFENRSLSYSEVVTNYQNTDFKRCVAFVDSSYFLVNDFIEAETEHEYDWLLHGNGGGNTGNIYNAISEGAQYLVNGVSLFCFVNSSESVTLSEYEDYNDTGSYGEIGTHTVMKASATGMDVVFNSYLLPVTTEQVPLYTPVNSVNYTGGSVDLDGNNILAISQNDTISDSLSIMGKTLESNAKLILITEIENDNPGNLFLGNGDYLKYNDFNLITVSENTTLDIDIGENITKGYISDGCELDLYTGNEPLAVTGAIAWSFDNGVTSLELSDDKNFMIEVDWSLTRPFVENLQISRVADGFYLEWEGFGYYFNIYRSCETNNEFELIDTTTVMHYLDNSIGSEKRCFYYITAEQRN